MAIIVTSTSNRIFEYIDLGSNLFRIVEHESPAEFTQETLLVTSQVPPFERKLPIVGKKDGEADQKFDGHVMRPGDTLENFYTRFGYRYIECR